jgi:sortase A
VFLVIAAIALGYWIPAIAESFVYQVYENRELDAILQSAPSMPLAQVSPTPTAGSIIGRIEIPRLSVSAIVRGGVDARTLRLAVGHIPGTALPGHAGNVGLAGHRDTFFRALRDIHSGDIIRMVTPTGAFMYRVDRTDVVQPRDVWVLDSTPSPALTLVTCYPFTFIGAAPERFVVRATLDRSGSKVRSQRSEVVPAGMSRDPSE